VDGLNKFDGDARFMRRAIALAREGDRRPGANPIGCVIVLDGEIVGEGYNGWTSATIPPRTPRPYGRGETLRQSEFRGATLYSTLQPCGMCTMASIWAKIGRIVYGAERDQVHPMYFEDRHLGTMDFVRDAFRDDLSVSGAR
jgi:tRNA(adenine34) deaminase